MKADLERLVDPVTRGDPESRLRWTSKSVRKLAAELNRMGHRTSHRMVAQLLHELGYSLQANRKTLEGSSHADRDQQFQHINQQSRRGDFEIGRRRAKQRMVAKLRLCRAASKGSRGGSE